MRFCDVEKIGILCDTYVPKTEKRKSGETKVVKLTLSLRLTPEIAAGIDPLVRRTCFRSAGELAPAIGDIMFDFGTPRQQLTIFASTDTPQASIVLDHVDITRLRAKRDKLGWTLTFKAALGPCGPTDLAYINEWFLTQRFVTFDAAQGTLFDGDTDPDDDEPPEVDGGELAPEASPGPRPVASRRRPTTH